MPHDALDDARSVKVPAKRNASVLPDLPEQFVPAPEIAVLGDAVDQRCGAQDALGEVLSSRILRHSALLS